MKHHLDPADFRTVLQLTIGLSERRDDPAGAADWLLKRLRESTGAANGVVGRTNGKGTLVPINTLSADGPDDGYIAKVAAMSRRSGWVIDRPLTRLRDDSLYSVLPITPDSVSVLWLQQPPSARRSWDRREVLMLDLLHPEITWLNNEPTTTGLSPRQSQTLRHLLRGQSEKQIAAELKLSVHTVHVHVKSIYRAHRVASRAELLAKWVRKS